MYADKEVIDMREIKFRAWDNETKTFIYSDRLICYKRKNYHRFSAGGSHDDYIDYAPDELLIEQYTGLRDKNGKEIYEGDILIYVDYPGYYFTVKFDYGAFFGDGINDDMVFCDTDGEEIKIIGNIHENPELLEPKNDTL